MQSSDPWICMEVLLFLFCLFTLVSSQLVSLGDTLRQGDTLNSTSKLESSDFTMEFYILDRYYGYIAIWNRHLYSSFPVWIYNRENPFSSYSSSNMMISSTGSLLIILGNGDDPIELYTGKHTGHNVTATLFNTGNLVLRDNDDDVILWQSFDYPTDILLPGMKLGINHKTGKTWSLTSWLRQDNPTSGFREVNPASGPFRLDWDPTTKRLLVRRRGVLYWSSGELRDYYVQWVNITIKKFQNMNSTDGSLNFTIFSSNDEEYLLIDYPWSWNTYVPTLRLDYQGDLHDNGILAAVSLCYGYNTYDFPGCQLWKQPECRNQQQTFIRRSGHFGKLESIQTDLGSFSDCREYCWNDCKCVGFEEDTSSGCLYWRGRNLKFEQSLDGSEPIIQVLDDGSNKGSQILIWIIVAVIISALLLLVAMALILARRSKRKRKEEMNELLTLEGYPEAYDHENGGDRRHDLRMFSYASIAASTNYFSEDYKLGEGGFGPVYKGQTAEGHEIAVKVLSRRSGQGLIEFKTELVLISKLQHVNLVKLVGFCIHREDKMIVYDYMPNKSLDFFLFDQSKWVILGWGLRFNIIQGIAQGLLYLHKYSRLSIVHRDLKCSNILLDENFNPKISDFGLARIFKHNTDEANTNRRVGTLGYMAPEYAMQGIFSFKSDVYSFGVLVLEIVSGRKNTSFQDIQGPLNLVEYAWELWHKDSSEQLLDPTLSRTCTEQLKRCINIGLLCVEHRAADRPDIEEIVSMFKHETTPLPPPRNPAFITRNNVIEQLGNSTTPPNNLSVNELSISEIGGR